MGATQVTVTIRLVPCHPAGKRQPDAFKGKIAILESFWDPLPDDELRAWEGKLTSTTIAGVSRRTTKPRR